MQNYTVCWLSGGVSSFISAYLFLQNGGKIDELIFIDIEDQTRDTLRFADDVSKFLNSEFMNKIPFKIMMSQYKNVENVVRTFGWINGVHGAKCTDILKRRPRKEWEREHKNCNLRYIWGYDKKETSRIERIIESNPNQEHIFPLYTFDVTKQKAHGILGDIGIKRPDMYELGYPNQNCRGCVKGGMGYWNKIRVDFPKVFATRAKLERDIYATCLKDKNGSIFLDELDPNRGDMSMEIFPDCGIACGVQTSLFV